MDRIGAKTKESKKLKERGSVFGRTGMERIDRG